MHQTQMESDSEISNLKKDVQRLENAIKAQSDVILQLIERTGETFAKQAFTVDELMKRWGCGETLARKIIRTHKLKLLRGADGNANGNATTIKVLQSATGDSLMTSIYYYDVASQTMNEAKVFSNRIDQRVTLWKPTEITFVLPSGESAKLNAFSYSGIYTSSSLSALGNYGAGIGSDLDSNGKYTFLTTYLGKTNNFMLFSPYNSDYNVFYPNINGQSFSVGYQYSYDEETGYSDYIPVSFNMTKPFEYGDKLALTIDDGNFKLYKNLEVICEGTLPEGFTVSDPASMLSWNGLKKDLIYSKSIKLPLTTAEGVSSKLNYSIEDFVKGVYPPKNLLSSRFLESVSAYTSAYSRILNGMRLTGGNSIGGKYNALKFSINPMNYSVNRECALSSTNSIYATGTQYRIKFNIYFPTDNPNIDKVQLKIGNYTPAGLGTIISKSDTIDNNGVITAKNEWQQIDITLQGNHAGVPKLCFYKGSRTNYSITTETTDAVYIRDYSFYGYQGIEGFFYGTPDSGIWKNFGCAICDISYYDGYSFPDSGNKIYTFRQNIVSFTDGAYIYFDSFPTVFALSQVVLRFNSAIPDTSEAAEESARNIFQLYMNGTFAHSEQIPQVQEGVSYNIYPKFGGPQSFYSLEVYSMYSCNCGGTIDFIFTKVQ